MNTFGASAVWGGEAWVFRLQAYYQPLREPNLFYVGTPQDPREQQYENRQILGLGADFVHSKHFKIYTEHYLTHTLSFAEHERRKNQRQVVPEGDSTYEIQNTVRTTNESIEDVKLSLDVTLAGPKTGLSLTPLASYRAGDFLWAIGGNYFNSIQSDSKFAPVDGHSLVFVQVESYFDAKGWGQSESSQ